MTNPDTPTLKQITLQIQDPNGADHRSEPRTWKRVDRFFCEKCLESQEIVKEEESKYEPEWWKGERKIRQRKSFNA